MAGMNAYSIKTTLDYDDQTAGSGFSGGAFARVKILMFYVQPEFLYRMRSTALTGTTNGQAYHIQVKDPATTINLLGGLTVLSVSDIFKVRASAGVGFVNTLKKKFEFNGVDSLVDDLRGNYSHFILGAGVDVGKLTADIRLETGFTDLLQSDGKVKDRMVLLILGYKLF